MTSNRRTMTLLAVLATFAAGPALADGDAEAGKKVFNKCKACHALEVGANKVGPSLAGVMGRAAGMVDGFKYSEALKSSGVVWDEQSLDAYLTKPKDFIPGNKMVFVGLKKEADRANVIAYLKEGAQ